MLYLGSTDRLDQKMDRLWRSLLDCWIPTDGPLNGPLQASFRYEFALLWDKSVHGFLIHDEVFELIFSNCFQYLDKTSHVVL